MFYEGASYSSFLRNSTISNALRNDFSRALQQRKQSISCKELISCLNNHGLYRNGCFKEELYGRAGVFRGSSAFLMLNPSLAD